MTTIGNRGLKGNPTLPYVDFRSFAGEDVVVDLTFLDRTGQAVTPYQVQWQLDDISNAINMQPPTILGTGTFTTNTSTLTLPASLMQMDKQFQGSQLCQLSLAMSYLDTRVTPNASRTVQEQYVIELVANQTPLGTILAPTAAPGAGGGGGSVVPGLPTGGAVFIGAQGGSSPGASTAGTNKYPYSLDGLIWGAGVCTPADPTSAKLGLPVWSPTLKLWVMPDGQGVSVTQAMYTSPDGLTWTARTMPSARAWAAVEWSSKLNLFCAVSGGAAAGAVATSPDGITWTARTAANVNAYTQIKWVPWVNGGNGFFIASAGGGFGSTNGSTNVMWSADGTTWNSQSQASGILQVGQIADSGTQLVAGLFGNVANLETSTDGVTWARLAGITGVNGNSFDNMLFIPGAGGTNGRFVSFNSGGGFLGTDYLDGHGTPAGPWTEILNNVGPGPINTARHYCGAAYSAALGVIVVMEEPNGLAYTDQYRIMYSKDNGQTWTPILFPSGFPAGWGGFYVAAAG